MTTENNNNIPINTSDNNKEDDRDSFVVPIKTEYLIPKPTRVNEEETTSEHPTDNDKKRKRGQNKNRKIARAKDQLEFCAFVAKGEQCPYEKCKYSHDLDQFLNLKGDDLGDRCIQFELKGVCPYGFKCRFLKAHCDFETKTLIKIPERLETYQKTLNEVEGNVKVTVKKGQYDFKKSDVVNEGLDKLRTQNIESQNITESEAQADVPEFDWETYVETVIKPREKKKLNFRHKTYLAPLTTVGNLPFRRICKGYGVDVTVSEMAMCTNLLQGQNSEWALVKRHPCEDIFGIQVAGNKPVPMVKCAQLFNETIDCDFVDINLGCPIDVVYKNGGGSALLGSPGKLERIVRGMSTILDCPLTVKIRTGIYDKKNVAHELIPRLQKAGASLITLHGRSRQQRYTKLSDWEYINQCSDLPNREVPFFGNGDTLSFTDYYERLQHGSLDGVMVGRGALIKPWIFQEIKERRHIDISSKERFEMLKIFCDFGLEHWGSDTQGVNHTRRFLLEWQSFLYRYVPVGLLEVIPQKINHRPPPFQGRDDLETLMASDNARDWVKLSEMLLGPTPADFEFKPKHVSNSYTTEG